MAITVTAAAAGHMFNAGIAAASAADSAGLVLSQQPLVYVSAAYTYSLFREDGSILENGDYGVEFYVGRNLLTSGTVTVGDVVRETRDISATNGVTYTEAGSVAVQGNVTDKQNRKPIWMAFVIVLGEGVDARQWLYCGDGEDVLSATMTDSEGKFTFTKRIPLGRELPWIVASSGYVPLIKTFTIDPASTSDPYEMDVALVRAK